MDQPASSFYKQTLDFHRVESISTTTPLVAQLASWLEPMDVFRSLEGRKHLIFFHSSMPHERLGRFSFLAFEPFDWILWEPSEADFRHERGVLERGLDPSPQATPIAIDPAHLFSRLRDRLQPYSLENLPDLPPFQGGAAGLLSYELNRLLEEIPGNQTRDFDTPLLAIGLYDLVLAWDHSTQETFLVSTGFPELSVSARTDRAESRLAQVLNDLGGSSAQHAPSHREVPACRDLDQADLADCFPTRLGAEVKSNFSESAYLEAVEKSIEYIHAGDIFQINLSQRLLAKSILTSVELFDRLCQYNSAPFASFFDMGEYQVISASPERLVNQRAGLVEARPIKGTCPTTIYPVADLFSGDQLKASRKDRAENIMIVDLLRNDLSRVCHPDSVQVTQLCGLEKYHYVQHLVSVVQGRLAEGKNGFDLLEAVFPGGSITGAPKVHSMELIAELEPTARGPYCGSLGYLGFNGELDFNILIRTFTSGRGWLQFPVGGGIVANSIPTREYEETWDKARGMLKALFG